MIWRFHGQGFWWSHVWGSGEHSAILPMKLGSSDGCLQRDSKSIGKNFSFNHCASTLGAPCFLQWGKTPAGTWSRVTSMLGAGTCWNLPPQDS